MTAGDLKGARQKKGWSQAQAAARLGVGQSYVAMLESGQRRFPAPLARKARKAFGLPPTFAPLSQSLEKELRSKTASQLLAEQLAALGYPGFAQLRRRRWKRNPAQLLLAVLEQDETEARLLEALPWLLLRYYDLDARWLVEQAKLRDLQNRLGFVVSLARRVAEQTKPAPHPGVAALRELEQTLDRSRLARTDTLGRSRLPEVERHWLEGNRSDEARHWNLLTDWRPEDLWYAQ